MQNHTPPDTPERQNRSAAPPAGSVPSNHFSLPILRAPRLLGAELACGAAQRAHLLRDRDRDRDRDHDRDRDRDHDRDRDRDLRVSRGPAFADRKSVV